MKNEEKARFLFEELGSIDDDLLYESSGRPLTLLKTKQKKRKRVILIAAALAAMVSVFLVSTVVSANQVGQGSLDGTSTSPGAAETPGGDPSEVFSEGAFHEVITSGKPAIIYTDGDAVKAKTLTESEFSSLLSLTKNNKTAVGNGKKAARKVWLTDGRGRVCSPLLRYTAGNVGATLFSYEQELALTAALEQKLEAVTGVDF